MAQELTINEMIEAEAEWWASCPIKPIYDKVWSEGSDRMRSPCGKWTTDMVEALASNDNPNRKKWFEKEVIAHFGEETLKEFVEMIGKLNG
jgi:hypothetical protein